MKRLLKKIAENHFSIVLAESSMEYINSFKPIRSFRHGQESEILKHWTLEYEIEYKYSMIESRPFSGLEQRKENIVNILEKKAKEIIPSLAETLYKTFKKWLAAHAITNPKQWARARMIMGDENIIDALGFDEAMSTIMFELCQYVDYPSGYDRYDLLRDVILEYGEEYNLINGEFLDLWVSDMYGMIIDLLENEGLDDFNSRYNTNFDDAGEAEQWIDNTFAAFDSDFFKWAGSREKAYNYILQEMDDIEFFEHFKHGDIDRFINDKNELLLLIYEKKLFPAWFQHWKDMGIVQTRKRVEDVTKDLYKIRSMPLEKQFMVLNIAKNLNHQNGSMMEYYEEDWGVDYVAMKRLSKMDTRNWDKELKEIGVDL